MSPFPPRSHISTRLEKESPLLRGKERLNPSDLAIFALERLSGSFPLAFIEKTSPPLFSLRYTPPFPLRQPPPPS